MKKRKFLDKCKKILIIIMCSITLFFSMPVRSEANVLVNVVNVFLIIPDGIMYLLNNFVSGTGVSKTHLDLNLKGVDMTSGTIGNIYNFEVTPYDIFTSGLTYHTPIDESGTQSEEEYIRIPILDINFFRADSTDTENYGNTSAYMLGPVVSSVYKSLRNLVLVLMLVVLVYIGIRIVIASAVSDQVKYKQWLVDWLVGICLLLLMQYIMSFLMNVNEIIVRMIGDNEDVPYYISISSLGDGKGYSSWGDVHDDANTDPEVKWIYYNHLDVNNRRKIYF